jgi:hypothetical protein
VSVLVSPNDPRGSAAVALVIADQWKLHFDPTTRELCADVPSSRPGRNYRTTAQGCTCSDLKYRPWTVCKHMLAVRLFEQLLDEEYAF